MGKSGSAGRWRAGAVLIGAMGMLAAGETALKGKLSGVVFLLYWLVCLVVTGLAIVLALRDLRAQTERARSAHRELLDSALKEIQAKADARGRNPQPHEPGIRGPEPQAPGFGSRR